MTSRQAARPSYGEQPRPQMVEFLPRSATRVLDVGCNNGAFGEEIKRQRGIEVWGLEPHEGSATQATLRLDKVIAAPFDQQANLPDQHFDAIYFNDVLEHIADPWAALQLAAGKLREGGVVIASIPNLRQIDNLEHILFDGDFRYESQGIRDRTHLRFFTRKSAIRLFEDSHYEVLSATGINPMWWSPSIRRRLMFRLVGKWLEDTRYMQFALVARPSPRL